MNEASLLLQTLSTEIFVTLFSVADPRGRQGRPPRSKFFHFHAVFGKKLKNNSTFGSWRTPFGKILDPPLILTLFLILTQRSVGLMLMSRTPVKKIFTK